MSALLSAAGFDVIRQRDLLDQVSGVRGMIQVLKYGCTTMPVRRCTKLHNFSMNIHNLVQLFFFKK